ncbi:T9SS type A sorting domain-containing protein [candidate division KSB1 bacterium]|nr:T9SS type A sorting domain-containing protein [candidate division KSB1 bacterium]
MKKSYFILACKKRWMFTLSVLWLMISVDWLAAGEWRLGGTMPEGRATFHTFAVDEKIFVVTGSNPDGSAVLQSVKEYDPQNQIWTDKAPIATGRVVSGGCALDGKIYVMGGQIDISAPSLATMEMYDPHTDTWTFTTDMNTARRCFGACTIDGKIYVAGGIGLTDLTNTVESYDPVTESWTNVTTMPFTRWGHAVCSVNDKLYLLGGIRDAIAGTVTNSLQEYDPQTDAWTEKAPMPTARTVFSVCVVDDKIHVLGGSTDGFPHAALSAVHEVYNPATDKWQTLEPMPTPRTYLSTSYLDGKIYAMGGNVTTVPGPCTDVIEVYSFRPAIKEDSWIELAKMGTIRGITAACSIHGKLYVVGDGIKVEEYDPKLNKWRYVRDMPIGRNGNAACALDSVMYVTGGQTAMGQPGLTSLHRYNPMSNVWNTGAADMPIGQYILDMCVCAAKLYAGCGLYHPKDLAQYDPVTNSWIKLENVPSLELTSLCGHDGILYAFGSTKDTQSVYAYNPETDSWQPRTAMPTGRVQSVARYAKGLIYTIGGTQDKSYPWDPAMTTGVVEAYDPVSDVWHTGFEPMSIPRFGAGACVIDSIIYVVGGVKLSGGCRNLEAYNPIARDVVNVDQKKNPVVFSLRQNYPNPFNPSTTIEYILLRASFVRLKVYDLLGREVRILVQEQQAAGAHSVLFEAGELPSNIYFYKLEWDGACEIRKMALLR